MTRLAILLPLCLTASTLAAEDKPAVKPHPVTLTFFVAGMECSACTDSVSLSVRQLKSVTDIQLEELGVVNISFDTHVTSAHQIAQAVTEAFALHGKPYEATLRIRVPDYAKGGNAAKVDEVFAKRKEWVKVTTDDRDKGGFTVHFLPLKVDASKPTPQGWNPGHFGHPVHDPAPKGLGLAFTLVRQGVAATGGK